MLDEIEQLVSRAEAKRITGISYAEMNRRQKRKEFPRPIQDGPYRNSRRLYVLSELLAYVRSKIAARDNAPS